MTQQTPPSVIGDNGRPVFGVFEDAIPSVNAAAFDYRTPMGNKASAFQRWVGFKQFEYFGVISSELLFGCALANVRYASVLFCYVYLPKTKELKEYTFRSPFALGTQNSDSPVQGQSHFKAPGCEVHFGYADAPRSKTITVNLGKKLQAELTLNETAAGFQPMSINSQIGRNGYVYAHKVAAVPVSGKVSGPFGNYDMEAINAYSHHDFSAGYMRRETFWNWACFSGELADGRSIGLNVSCGVNETSYSENCYWLDGACISAGQAQFDYEQDDPMQPWTVTFANGKGKLHFTPEGLHLERQNFLLAASNFKQVFGRFDGFIETAEGERLEIQSQYGFVEDQYAKW
ncbi:MAG: DUF2804 domain-containing protein [Gammaproteobacteria bacterium]|nr:DUF2804 domain-containing protein [Gammaproteobacteria bacterium]